MNAPADLPVPNPPRVRKPDWIRVKAPTSEGYAETRRLMRSLKLATVCEEAACPNIGECWTKKHATVMILGDTCTRACAFCNVKTGMPRAVDPFEPQNTAIGITAIVVAAIVLLVPVAVAGTDRIQPIGASWPRPHRFSVTFGKPLTFPEYRGKAGNGKARREVTDTIMEAIAELSGQEKAGW